MLIKITNQCGMGCSHCMEDSTPAPNQHMAWDTFLAALEFSQRVEGALWGAAGVPVLLSGGECSEHPEFIRYLEHIHSLKWPVILISNGMWLNDPELKAAILRPEWSNMQIQISNDPRVYPTAPPPCDDPRVYFVPTLTHIIKLGRAKKRQPDGIAHRKYPASFNLRSLTRALNSFSKAVQTMRVRVTTGQSQTGNCTPSVTHEGHVLAGETRGCWQVGTVHSTDRELTRAVIDMGECNHCGLEDNLGQRERRAIGLSSLYLPNE